MVVADTLTSAGGTKKRKTGMFVRQHDIKYFVLGFTASPCREELPRPLCLACSQIVSNDPTKLLIISKDYSVR